MTYYDEDALAENPKELTDKYSGLLAASICGVALSTVFALGVIGLPVSIITLLKINKAHSLGYSTGATKASKGIAIAGIVLGVLTAAFDIFWLIASFAG